MSEMNWHFTKAISVRNWRIPCNRVAHIKFHITIHWSQRYFAGRFEEALGLSAGIYTLTLRCSTGWQYTGLYHECEAVQVFFRSQIDR